MIHINATTYDLQGSLSIRLLPSSDEPSLSRRVSRVATLDQGVAVNDRGFSEGDRTFAFAYKPVSREHDNIAKRIIKIHSKVTVSTPEGVFLAAPESFNAGAEENTLTLLIISKLSED